MRIICKCGSWPSGLVILADLLTPPLVDNTSGSQSYDSCRPLCHLQSCFECYNRFCIGGIYIHFSLLTKLCLASDFWWLQGKHTFHISHHLMYSVDCGAMACSNVVQELNRYQNVFNRKKDFAHPRFLVSWSSDIGDGWKLFNFSWRVWGLVWALSWFILQEWFVMEVLFR